MQVKFAAGVLALAVSVTAAQAEDTIKLAIGQRGNWDTSISEIGQRVGIFKKHGLVLDMVYTQGAGKTAGGHIRQRQPRHRRRHYGLAECIFKGRAASHHQRRNDRRKGSLLVRKGGFS